jgi:hypothetical protein
VIKRLWQFPAVIGGTAVLTFCGVSSLQAGMNGPLRAFGASIEAARASASASASAEAIAAGSPVYRSSGGAVESTPSAVQAAGAVASPPQVSATAPAPGPASPSSYDGEAHQSDRGREQSGLSQEVPAGGQARTSPGQDVLGRDGISPSPEGAAAGLGATSSGLAGAAAGLNDAAPGPSVRSGASAGSTGTASMEASRQLSQELNRWLRLTGPHGLAANSGAKTGNQAEPAKPGNQGAQGKAGTQGHKGSSKPGGK